MPVPHITPQMIATYLKIDMPVAPTDPDTVLLNQISAMMDGLVFETVPEVRALPDPVAAWPAPIEHAALMMAGRIFTRRRSPTGIATYTETGGPVYTPRWDPDIEKMMGIGKWAPPGFA